MAAVDAIISEPAVEKRSLKALTLQSLKRTYDMFAGNYSVKAPADERSQRAKIACKIRDEYAAVQTLPAAQPGRAAKAPSAFAPSHAGNGAAALDGAPGAAPPVAESRSTTAKLIESMPEPADRYASCLP
ncbi:hypothetical protein WJX84_009485 [Apatococcus fuscideae]|uniref:Uncharacterized protein n=1 Tax=Apatococcus fuscideae TaxID=2026836 RepID=A0AAW1RKV3_9CHLO